LGGRRTGIGALDAEQINELISNGKLLFPFLNNQRLTTSEDDNVSLNSFKDLKLDEFLKQIGRKAETQGGATQTTMFTSAPNTGATPQIQEYNTTDDEKISLRGSGGRNSKNSGKGSVKSRRSLRNVNTGSRRIRRNSQRSSGTKVMRRDEKKDKEKEDVATNMSSSSFSSDLVKLAAGLQSSQSVTGVSIDKMNNSHGSKRSCDVGIQANAHEIATSFDYEVNEKHLKNEENEDIYMTESHALLPKQTSAVAIGIGRNRLSISESEKLKLLLLPSK
jgi:smoothened